MKASKDSPTTYSFDDLVVDRENFRVAKGADGTAVSLSPRAFDLLVYLIDNRPRVVAKQELFEKVWAGAFVTDNALTRTVTDLRRAIGDNAESPVYIETVQKRGYRFIAEVVVHPVLAPRESQTIEPAAVAVEEPPRDAPPVTTRRSLTAVQALGLAGVAAALAVAVWWGVSRGTVTSSAGVDSAPRALQLTIWQGLDMDPVFSPDGQTVAYASSRSGRFVIYVKPLTAGAREIQLTADGEDSFQPTWSPDGTRIAYHSRTRAGVWVVPASGGVPRQLTEFGAAPAWSPDGASIVFQSYPMTDVGATSVGALPPSQLWKVSPAGGDAVALTEAGTPTGGHGAPAWSANGQRLVFVAYSAPTAEIWTAAADGSDLKRLTGTRTWLYDPVYSPDGHYVYYGGVTEVGAFALYKLPVSPVDSAPTGPPIEVASTGTMRVKNLAISPDGGRLVYSAPTMAGALMAAPVARNSGEARGEPAPLTRDTAYRKGLPRISPDGRRVAYVENRGGVSQDVWVIDADGGNPVQLTTDPAVDWGPSWFADNERIAFQSNREGVQRVWSVSTRTGREAVLAEPPQGVGWPMLSPDGTTLAFNLTTNGAINTWTMAVGERSEPVQLTFDRETAGWPTWSPDGKRLALQMKRGDDTHVVVIPSAGGPTTQLTFDRGQSWPYSWSPDGDKIAFAGLRDGIWNVYSVSSTTGAVVQVTHYTALNTFVRYPDWSPSGDRIVYEYAETAGNIWMMELR